MKIVNNIGDIENNLNTLSEYSNIKHIHFSEYKELIKKGTCFIVYMFENKTYFAPSKFTGYQKNTIKKHKEAIQNKEADGRDTNRAIDHILGKSPHININVEKYYSDFCANLGIEANPLGSFGVARKYWLLPNVDILEGVDDTLSDDVADIGNDNDLTDTEKETLIKARKGQGKYRKELIKYWGNCAITSCNEPRLLRASHIKPWRYCTNKERLDVYNGILLNPNYDILFDLGYITFENTGNIVISKALNPSVASSLNVNENAQITFKENHFPYIKFHRKNIFIKA